MMHMKPTPANTSLPVKIEPYSNLVDALEYAAQGDTGFNFYDGRGHLSSVLSYADLRDEAKVIARRLLSLGCERGGRVGIIAETEPMFHRFFFACQYAGLIPVALPAGIQLGAHGAYVSQVRRMLKSCGASIVVAPDTHANFRPEQFQCDGIFQLQQDVDGSIREAVKISLGQVHPGPAQYRAGCQVNGNKQYDCGQKAHR